MLKIVAFIAAALASLPSFAQVAAVAPPISYTYTKPQYFSGGLGVTTLTPSLPICTDASKNLTSNCPAGDLPILIGTTSVIGGGALAPGACAAGTAAVTGATSSMVATASPSADPDSTLSTGIAIYAFVSSSNTVTVRVCAIVAVTPASVTYNVRVIQ